MNRTLALTQESIHRQLDASPKAVEAALLAVYERQMQEERAYGTTRETNGVGFSRYDAEFCTSLVEQIQRGRSLSHKQLAIARNKMKRYWRQLVTVMTTEPPQPMLEPRDNEPTAAPLPPRAKPAPKPTHQLELEAIAQQAFNSW